MNTNTNDPVRPVTPREVQLFRANGWVKLRNFIPPEIAVAMREEAQRRMTAGADAEGGGKVRTKAMWSEWR
jgi:hypothetical protein